MTGKYLGSLLILLLLVTGPALAAEEEYYYHEGEEEEAVTTAVHTSLGDLGFSGLNQARDIVLNRLNTLRLAARTDGTAIAGRLTPSGPVLASIASESGLGLGIWTDGFGVCGEQDRDGLLSGYDYDTRGISLGVDKVVSERLILGMSGGQADTEVDYDGVYTEHEVDAWSVNFYGAYTGGGGKWFLDGALSYADNEYDSERMTGAGLATSDHDGTDMAVCVSGGYVMPLGGVNVIPTLSLEYAEHDEDDFMETAGGASYMQVYDFDAESFLSRLGVRVNRLFRLGGLDLMGQARLQWAHEFADTDREATARFAGTPTSAAFTVKGIEPDRDSALYGLDLSLRLNRALSLNLSYDGEWRDEFTAQGLAGGLRYIF